MATSYKGFDKLYFPKIPPEKAVGDYLTSKRQDEMIRKHPEWDVARATPTTNLVKAKRELHDAELRLQKKKAERAQERLHMDAQWKDLSEKEELFKESFIKFNKFVKENREKRERAEKKIAEEIAVQERRNADIADLRQKYEYMHNVKTSLEENIKTCKIYEDYLISVVKSSTEFKSTTDILNRYEALADARRQLAQRQEQDLVALENARSDMIKLIEDKLLITMGLNNIVADLQIRYESAKTRALQWENVVSKIANTCVRKMCELNGVRAACWNVYQQMCKRKEIEPEYEEGDIENQLMFIKKTMTELQHIVRVAKRRGNRDLQSNRSEMSVKRLQ